MRTPTESPWRPCANDNCPRPASPGEPLCETCALEFSLYRRAQRRAGSDDREPFSLPREPRALGTIPS